MDSHAASARTSLLHSSSIMDIEAMDHVGIPIIEMDESLITVIPKLSNFIKTALGDMTLSFENMQHGSHGHRLRQLVHALAEDSHNPFIIVALMILKWEFSNAADDDWGLNESRGSACEFVAWQFLCHLDQDEIIEFLLEELPNPRRNSSSHVGAERRPSETTSAGDEEITPLLSRAPTPLDLLGFGKRTALPERIGDPCGMRTDPESYDISRYTQFFGLNALEIAVIGQAKRFLSQRVIQRVVNDIWNGEVVFWDSLTVHSTKKPQIFNRKTADPYSRLRVPVYRKMFEAAFFISFLLLYYSVLLERKQVGIGLFEAILYVWIAAFAYDEMSGAVDAGVLFYQMDFWSLWNLGIIGVGFAFIITRIIGLGKEDDYIVDVSFDVLSLEALFLVPRYASVPPEICSLVSLNSYFGSLVNPCVERNGATKAFLRFLPVVVVLYIGMDKRHCGTVRTAAQTRGNRAKANEAEMSWMLVKVFFGSGSLGLDSASEISPIFGYGLMKRPAITSTHTPLNMSRTDDARLIYVSMTNILLLSSLISLMSMSLEGVMLHAREEYLFQLSVYVLESSNSRRLTYFMPPLNLIPLLCIRPMRLFLSAETVRRVRIVLLRATHLPFVMLIWAYEASRRRLRVRAPERKSGFSRCQDPQHSTLELTSEPGNERPVEPGLARSGQAQVADMIDAVDRLRAQVERVATNFATQQRT
ncbi:hypothetical protein N7512_002013 [Penicillium capsulatum]|nr:hypothetical protein N7512_002013 [Penicillium capsulatum]